MTSVLDIAQVQANLAARIVGRRLLYYPQLSSTNDEVRRLAAAGEPEGTVVVAETQIAGRGRRGRQWIDIPGHSLLLSILLRPPVSPQLLPILSLGTAAAAAQALSGLYQLNMATKWPNDLLIGRRKVGGILLEGGQRAVVIGLGLNVTGEAGLLQQQIPLPVTTVAAECDCRVQREEVLIALLEKIDVIYDQFNTGQGDTIIAGYKQFDCVLGKYVMVEAGAEKITGQAVNIGPGGALIIETAAGRREITAGDVHLPPNSP